MLLSGERGVVCATLCAVTVSVCYLSRYRHRLYMKYYVITLALCLLLFVLYLATFPSDFISSEIGLMRYFNINLHKEGINIRGKLWGIALNGFKDYPILGWGIDNFRICLINLIILFIVNMKCGWIGRITII